MNKTKIGELNLTIDFDISYETAYVCARLIEMYLNRHPDETLYTRCDECGNWDLQISKVIKVGEK